MTYLERYVNGEHEAVWADLIHLGASVRQEPLYSDARAVAQETMRRVRHNIDQLYQRLVALDYRFVEPRRALVLPPADVLQKLERFEAEFGSLPLSLWAWFEIVGGVDFRGDHPALCGYDTWGEPPESSDFRPHDPHTSFPYYADPLCFWDIDTAVFILEDQPGVPIADTLPHHLIEADWCTKAGASGTVYVISLPSLASDAPLEDEPRRTTFVDYLRTSFKWGGFPGFELHTAPRFEEWRRQRLLKPSYPGVPVPFDLLQHLADGLLPI